jgi:polyadenylation factor subunit 2
MVWSNYQKYLVTGDRQGNIVYCNENIDSKNRFSAHFENCVRDLSFSQSSVKFVSCSDDRTAKVWDFATSRQENKFQEHNSDVTTCDWHPSQSLIVTGSKDQTIRIWDPRSIGKSLF